MRSNEVMRFTFALSVQSRYAIGWCGDLWYPVSYKCLQKKATTSIFKIKASMSGEVKSREIEHSEMASSQTEQTVIPPNTWGDVKTLSAKDRLIQKSRETPFVPIGEILVI